MLLLQTLRQTYRAETLLRRGEWQGWELPLSHDPDDKVLGILGLGGVGRALSLRALPFGLKLIYHNRHLALDNPAGAEYVEDLDDFLGRCDILSIHLPLSQSTRHFIGKRELGIMKKGVVIVNTARGPIIDENALVEALESGQVGGLGSDVFEEEPKVHEGLLKRDDVVLLPHIGTRTVETKVRFYPHAPASGGANVRGSTKWNVYASATSNQH
jgi:D-3-phosphoglycerate dehydrogenase